MPIVKVTKTENFVCRNANKVIPIDIMRPGGDDFYTCRFDSTISGYVLANDDFVPLDSPWIIKVNGTLLDIGASYAGSNGGVFIFPASDYFVFDPDHAFDSLEYPNVVQTSVEYYVTDGIITKYATITVEVFAVQ